MKKEKLTIVFVAIVLGLLVSGIAFYLYQTTKEIPTTKIKKVAVLQPTASPRPSVFVDVTSPSSESVSTKPLITVSGKTVPNAKFIVVTPVDESSGISTADGDFSTTVNLDSDQNIMRVTVVAPNGETASQNVVVTYSTEDF